MDIKIREPLYLQSGNTEYIVRQGTSGIDRNKVVFFYDNTRTMAVGFSRDFCLENPQMFQVSRTIADRSVSLRDVAHVIDKAPIDDKAKEILTYLVNEL